MSNERYIPGKKLLAIREAPPIGVSSEPTIPPEVQSLIDKMPRLAPAPRQLLDHLARNFQMPVTPTPKDILQKRLRAENILLRKVGKAHPDPWLNDLRYNVQTARRVLPEPLALYSVNGFFQYMLDWRHPIGEWLLLPDRVEVIEAMPEEIRPLAEFCNQVEVKNSICLAGRLSRRDVALINLMGLVYPKTVEHAVLIREIWPVSIGSDRNTLRTQICCIREKIRPFRDWAFDILVDKGIGYRLALRYPLASSPPTSFL